MLRRLTLVGLVLAALPVLGSQPAFAGDDCPQGTSPVQTKQGVICVVVADPGSESTPGDQGALPSTDQEPRGCYKHDGIEVPCVTELGTWWPGAQCYAHPYDAPPGSPAWQGHTDGSLWMCSACVEGDGASTCNAQVIWLAPGTAPGPPSPGQLATTAVGVMPLATADVHTAPKPPDPTYIGVENWMWIPAAQWATLTKTVTAGGTSVTVTARPAQVVWQMGAGSKICFTSGRVWQQGMGDAAVTSCGFTYEHTSDDQPDEVFRISATIRYQVDWTCTGTCPTRSGRLGLVEAPAGGGTMRVLERQTVVVR